MNNRFYYIFIFFTLVIGLKAQVSLEGYVLDKATGLPLANVEVFNQNNSSIVSSDKNGFYTFETLEPGDYVFTSFAIGYASKTVSLKLDTSIVYNFRMETLNVELSKIEIAERKQELFEIKRLDDVVGTSIYAGKKSEVIVMDLVNGNLGNNNSRQIYAQVTGLNIYEGSDGGLQLNIGGRGLDPNRSSNFNIRQNGYDISADVLGYPESYYAPPAEAIDEIRVIRGAASLQFGTQFGGHIDFRLRSIPSFKKLDLKINQTISSFGTFNSFNSIGLRKGKFALNAFYNYKKGNGYRPNSSFLANNVFLSLQYEPSSSSTLKLEYTYYNSLAKQAGGLTDDQFELNPRLSTRNRNWFAVNWNLFSFSYKQDISKNTYYSIELFSLMASRNSVGYRGNPINLNENPITSIDEQDLDGNYINPRDLILGNFFNYGAEYKFIHKYNWALGNSVLLLGTKYYNANNTSVQAAGSLAEDADFDVKNMDFPDYPNQSSFTFPNLNYSFFAENILYLNDRISITPGIRIEHIKTRTNGVYNEVVFDNAGNPISNISLEEDKGLKRSFALLGLGISYKKNDSLQLITNISQNYRSVTFSDIRVVSPSFVVDPNIKDESGLTWDFGVKGRFGKVLSYDFTFFTILYNDRIGTILDDKARRTRKNIGRAFISGSESLVNINFARWITPGKRNFKWSTYLNSAFTYSRYISSEENNVVGNRVEFIPLLNLKFGINLGYKNFDATYQYSYLSSQFTDSQNSAVASIGDKANGIIGPIPSYHVADLTLNYKIKNYKLSFGLNNLFNNSYFTRRASGYPGPGIIPSESRTFFVTLAYQI